MQLCDIAGTKNPPKTCRISNLCYRIYSYAFAQNRKPNTVMLFTLIVYLAAFVKSVTYKFIMARWYKRMGHTVGLT